MDAQARARRPARSVVRPERDHRADAAGSAADLYGAGGPDALRRRYGCTILVVHHTGHADKNRARGAIALKAALDAEYRLSNNDAGLKLSATKMKDAETPKPLSLELVSVELPGVVDDYGNPVTSAAVEVVDADTSALESQARAMRPRGKWQ